MKVIKSFRKTLTMTVDKTGELIVKAPIFVSKKKIEKFVLKNKTWVEEQKYKIVERIKKFNEGEKFYFFGEEYELKFSGDYKEIYFDGMNFYLSKDYKKEAQKFFEKFYKKEAKKYLKNRLDEIANKYNLEYNVLKITSAKTRWGSCTSKRNINFSFRLIMAPLKTIDYVIVHELAHLTHMNHSKDFWLEVDIMMTGLFPGDYKIHKDWLKKFGDDLIF